MSQGYPILSLVTWLPIAFGVAVLAMASDRNPAPARWTALAGSVLGFLAGIPLWTGFSAAAGGAMQFQELHPWIPLFNVNYHLGVDGISMPLILLNSFMTVLVVVAHWEVITEKVSQYLAAFLVMSGLINGTFAALDAILARQADENEVALFGSLSAAERSELGRRLRGLAASHGWKSAPIL